MWQDPLPLSRRGICQLNCRRNVIGPHVPAKFPANNVAAVIVQVRTKREPTPTNDLELGEIGMPHRVDGGGYIRELINCFDHNVA